MPSVEGWLAGWGDGQTLPGEVHGVQWSVQYNQ